ncbi:MAG: hypothetical protein ABJN62_19405 [Halioglobus sp.]
MKVLLKNYLLICVLALSSIGVAVAQNTTADPISAALAEGKSPAAIIEMLTADPSEMSLEEATLAAVDAGGESNQEAFAVAGIAAAGDLVEAESLATALKAAGIDASVVDASMQQFVRLMDQPFIHHDGTIPTGGGNYTPGPIIGGGTLPPVGGTGERPGVSPSS